MSTTLNISKLGGTIVWDYEQVLAWGNAPSTSQFAYANGKLAQGTGVGQADTLYVATITLAASGTQTITLSSFADMFGNTKVFARVKGIYIDQSPTPSASPANLQIGGAATHPAFIGTIFDDATAVMKLNSGGNFTIVAPDATGYPVVLTTSDQLLFTNLSGSNPCTFNIAIVGCSV